MWLNVGLRYRSAQPTFYDFSCHRLGDFHPVHGGGDDAVAGLPDRQFVVGAYRSVFGDQRDIRRRRFRGDQAVEDVPGPAHSRRRAYYPFETRVG